MLKNATSLRLSNKSDLEKSVKEAQSTVGVLQTAYDNTKREREKLGKQLRDRQLHREQYKTQRLFCARLEAILGVGECIIYRDFVNFTDAKGTKIFNQIWVMLTRDGETGRIRKEKLHHLSSSHYVPGSTQYYFLDILRMHLEKNHSEETSRVFEGIHKIYFCGDNGSHFANMLLHAFASMSTKKYGILMEFHYLCSYHAYNRCDGEGSRLVSCLKWYNLQGVHFHGPVTITTMINDDIYSMFPDSHAWFIPTLNNSSLTIFPTGWTEKMGIKAQKQALIHCVRKYAEASHEFLDEDDLGNGVYRTQPGVVLFRAVSGVGPFEICDYFQYLRAPEEGTFCSLCSQENQKPMYHTRSYTCKGPPKRQLNTNVQPPRDNHNQEQLNKLACPIDRCQTQTGVYASEKSLYKHLHMYHHLGPDDILKMVHVSILDGIQACIQQKQRSNETRKATSSDEDEESSSSDTDGDIPYAAEPESLEIADMIAVRDENSNKFFFGKIVSFHGDDLVCFHYYSKSTHDNPKNPTAIQKQNLVRYYQRLALHGGYHDTQGTAGVIYPTKPRDATLKQYTNANVTGEGFQWTVKRQDISFSKFLLENGKLPPDLVTEIASICDN